MCEAWLADLTHHETVHKHIAIPELDEIGYVGSGAGHHTAIACLGPEERDNGHSQHTKYTPVEQFHV